MSRTATTTTKTGTPILSLRGVDDARKPRKGYQYTGALDQATHRRVNPVLGERFDNFDLKAVFEQSEAERDAILRDIAILSALFLAPFCCSFAPLTIRTVARRGVVVFKRQDNFPPEQLGELVHRLGQLTGKPSTSHLHIHPLNPGEYNEDGSRKGGEKITTEKDSRGAQISAPDERSDFASYGYHADVTFEPVPSDFTVLRMSQIPDCGGDTMFASAYEAYDRLSPSMKVFLEGLTATHDAAVFRAQAQRYGFKLFAGPRGSPEDVGEEVCTTHPVVMVREAVLLRRRTRPSAQTHPITGWKALFVNRTCV